MRQIIFLDEARRMKPYTYTAETPYGKKYGEDKRKADARLAQTRCDNARNLSTAYKTAMSAYVASRIAAMRAANQGQPANPTNPSDDK